MIFKISEFHNVFSLNQKFILKNFNGYGRYTFGWRTSKPQLKTNINFCLCILVYRDVLIGNLE